MASDGQWAVEGVGVEPDIEVVDRPELVAKGTDPTLEKGVGLLMEELQANPPREVSVPTVSVER
jgi:tricorn protease